MVTPPLLSMLVRLGLGSGSISTWIDLAHHGGHIGGWGIAGVLAGGEFSPVKGVLLRLPCPCVTDTWVLPVSRRRQE
jgi:hypothetical protein